MRWPFGKSDADVSGAREEVATSEANLQRAKELQAVASSQGKQSKILRDSNGFAEAVIDLYRAR